MDDQDRLISQGPGARALGQDLIADLERLDRRGPAMVCTGVPAPKQLVIRL